MDNQICAIIPCFKPQQELILCLRSLKYQSYKVTKTILLDSSPSNDVQIMLAERAGEFASDEIIVIPIKSSDFDHGGTRTLGLQHASKNFEYCIFVTQDAVLHPNCIGELYDFLQRQNLAGAYARQLPREGAKFVEETERLFNYADTSYVVESPPSSLRDIFFSNTCALYRVANIIEVGGFVSNCPTAEDMLTANSLLKHHRSIGYCATALVYHSHDYSFTQVFRRFFDTGATHRLFADVLPSRQIRGTGLNFLRYALARSPKAREVLQLAITSTAKYLGYLIGKYHFLLPSRLKPRLSSNPSFWRRHLS